MQPKGVYFDENVVTSWSDLSERHYLEEIFKALDENHNFFSTHQIHVRSSNPGNDPIPFSPNDDPDKKRVLIYLSESKLKTLPHWITKNYEISFRHHNPQDSSQVLAFPHGYEKSTADFDTVVPWSDRNINVFFSGALNEHRMSFYKEIFGKKIIPNKVLLKLLKSKFKGHFDFQHRSNGMDIQFNNGWKTGLNAKEYSEKLSHCKISVCARGYFSPESFRHHESMRLGCIVISDLLPDTCLYKDSPIIQLASWRDFNKTVKSLLESEEECFELHHRSLEWWEKKWSPEAVAKRMAERI